MPQVGHREGKPVGRPPRSHQRSGNVRRRLPVEGGGARRAAGAARLRRRAHSSARSGAASGQPLSAPGVHACADLPAAAAVSRIRISAQHAVLGEPGVSGGHTAAAQSGLPAERTGGAAAAVSATVPDAISNAVSAAAASGPVSAAISGAVPVVLSGRVFATAALRGALSAGDAQRAGLAHAARHRSGRSGRRRRLSDAAAELRRTPHRAGARAALSPGAARAHDAAALSGQQPDRAALAVARSHVGRDHRLGDAHRDSPKRCSRRRKNGSASRSPRSSRSPPIRAAA